MEETLVIQLNYKTHVRNMFESLYKPLNKVFPETLIIVL